MNVQINVINQKLKIATNLKTIVSGSQEFIRFEFCFDEDWNELTTFAQFRQGDMAYNQYLDDENCVYLPPETKPGECMLMLYGTKSQIIATTNYVNLTIDSNMLLKNADSVELTLPLYNQLVEKVHRAALPYIGEDGNWYYDGEDTGISALGGVFDAQENAISAIHEAQEDAVSDIETACQDRVDEIDEVIRNANIATDNANMSENERNTAELLRENAEDTRIAQETSRQNEESNRNTAEQARNNSENTRIANEQARQDAESARSDAEAERATAEEQRKQSEENRQSAEESRAAMQQECINAENIRQQNENARETAEGVRKQAEIERTSEHAALIDEGNQMIEKIRNMSAGVSPTVDVKGIEGGHRVAITDADSTETFDVLDGAIGEPGIGVYAVEQTVTSSEDGGDNVITVTLTDGTSSAFVVRNGTKGSRGAPNEIDDTLSISGAAADAAATGNKFAELNSQISEKVTKGGVSLKATDDGAGNVTLSVLSS